MGILLETVPQTDDSAARDLQISAKGLPYYCGKEGITKEIACQTLKAKV